MYSDLIVTSLITYKQLMDSLHGTEQLLYRSYANLLKYSKIVYHVDILDPKEEVNPDVVWLSFEFLNIKYVLRKGNYIEGLDQDFIRKQDQFLKLFYDVILVLEREQEDTKKELATGIKQDQFLKLFYDVILVLEREQEDTKKELATGIFGEILYPNL